MNEEHFFYHSVSSAGEISEKKMLLQCCSLFYSVYFGLWKLKLLWCFLTKFNFPFTPSFLMSSLITSCCSRHSTMAPQALIFHAGADTFCRIDFWSIASESEETVESSPEGELTPYKPQSASRFDSQVGNNAVCISTFPSTWLRAISCPGSYSDHVNHCWRLSQLPLLRKVSWQLYLLMKCFDQDAQLNSSDTFPHRKIVLDCILVAASVNRLGQGHPDWN